MQHPFIQLLIKFPKRILQVFFAIILAIPARLEQLLFHSKINQTKISKVPVFILGHWRSGTTYLHSLMALDSQFGYLNNAQAFAPMAMLLRQSALVKIMSKLLPKQRWDGVKLSAKSPQEEEFALYRLFGESAYSGWHYPNKLESFFRKYGLGEFDLESDYQQFRKQYFYLFKKLTLANNGKSLLLKNPINTGRVQMLMDLFPDAKFIYLKRNPREVLLSAKRMHKTMIDQFSITGIGKTDVSKFVKKFHQALLEKYETDKHLIPTENLIEIDYSFFISEPEETLKIIYKNLELENYTNALPAFQSFIQKQGDYQPAVWQIEV